MIPKLYSLSTFVLLAVLVPLLVGTQGAAKSVIVDNADTRILYSPDGWATDVTCPSCLPQLDKSRVNGRTWAFSNNTANTGFSFFFTGISIELRYIACDTVQLLPERVTYAIDGVQYGIAAQSQPLSPISFAYDQSLFKVTGLANAAHTLQVNIVQASSVLLDYLIYEEADPVATSAANVVPVPSSNPAPAPAPTINTNANSNPITNANAAPGQTPNVSVNSVQATNANANTNQPTSAGPSTHSNSTTANGGVNPNPTAHNDKDSSPTTNTLVQSSSYSNTSITVSDTSSNSGSTPTTNVGAIVGGVTGGLAFLFLTIFLIYLRRRRRGDRESETTSAPYFTDAPLSATTPALRDFKNYRSLSTVMSQMAAPQPLPDQPVEAGLMSSSRYTSSDASRRTT